MRTKRSCPYSTCHVNYNLNEVFTYKVNDDISRSNFYIPWICALDVIAPELIQKCFPYFVEMGDNVMTSQLRHFHGNSGFSVDRPLHVATVYTVNNNKRYRSHTDPIFKYENIL